MAKGYSPRQVILDALAMSPQSARSVRGMGRTVVAFREDADRIPDLLAELVEAGAAERYTDNGVEMFRLPGYAAEHAARVAAAQDAEWT